MSAQSFFDELKATYPVNPFNWAERIVGQACVAFEPSTEHPADEVYLAFIKSLEQGCGAASAALKKMTELADKHNVAIRLFVHPIRSGARDRKLTLNREKLASWYKRNGFEAISRGYMVRQPASGQVSPKCPMKIRRAL